jgi:hypothetical protein
MSGPFYKLLGYAIWKGGIWYVRRNSAATLKRAGAGALALAAVAAAGAIAIAQRRGRSRNG